MKRKHCRVDIVSEGEYVDDEELPEEESQSASSE